MLKLGLPYLQIKKRGHFGEGRGYYSLLVNFFCEGASLIKSNGGKRNSISNSQAPSFLSTIREK